MMHHISIDAELISILIVNWNTRDLLRACLLSIREHCSGVPHEVIVVENASHDGSAQMVRNEFPEVLLLANDVNNGFAQGNNQAYARARGAWIWLLNPDTEVCVGAAQQMRDFLAADARRGAVASTLIDAREGRPQRSCRTFPSPSALWSEASGLARFYPRSRKFGSYRMGWWNYRDTRRVEQPQASSFMVRRDAIEQIGGLFDEEFPIFFNDVDLCWRLWQSGWEVWFLHEAKVLHWGGASTGQAKPEMIEESHRSLRRFYQKHYRGRLPFWLYSCTLGLIELSGSWRHRQAQRRARRVECYLPT
jgi:GT2 family glycosyltransferase